MSTHPSTHSLPLLLWAALFGLTACVTPTSPKPESKPWRPGTTLTPASAAKPAAPSTARKRNGTEIVIAGEMTVATGTYTVSYSLEYYDYKETDVGARVRFRLPGVEQQGE